MYIYNENYSFELDDTDIAILCNEIKPHLSDNTYGSIFYDKYPKFIKDGIIKLEGITIFKE